MTNMIDCIKEKTLSVGPPYLISDFRYFRIGKEFPHKHFRPYVYMPGGPGKEGENGELNLYIAERR